MRQTEPQFRFELLRDRQGIYGVGILGDPELPRLLLGSPLRQKPPPLILRPDHIRLLPAETDEGIAAYRPIDPSRIFRGTLEEQFRTFLEFSTAMQSGASIQQWQEDWNAPPHTDARRRKAQRFRDIKATSYREANNILAIAFGEAAPDEVLSTTRRYALPSRHAIYRAAARSDRFLQLADTFPVLAHKIALHGQRPEQSTETIAEAINLVEQGALLKHVADVMGVSMAMRKIAPHAAHIGATATRAFADAPDLIHAFLPSRRADIGPWMSAVANAMRCGPTFARWAARHYFEFGGGAKANRWLADIGDWVRACNLDAPRRANVPSLVTRPFNPAMSPRTVTRLAEEWHEALLEFQAMDRDFGQVDAFAAPKRPRYIANELPPPWLDGAIIDGFEITPITGRDGLYREGKDMGNCVGTYGDFVAQGESYIYTVRRDKKPVGTLELWRDGRSIRLGQFRGRFNKPAPLSADDAVRKWLRLNGARIGLEPPQAISVLDNEDTR